MLRLNIGSRVQLEQALLISVLAALTPCATDRCDVRLSFLWQTRTGFPATSSRHALPVTRLHTFLNTCQLGIWRDWRSTFWNKNWTSLFPELAVAIYRANSVFATDCSAIFLNAAFAGMHAELAGFCGQC